MKRNRNPWTDQDVERHWDAVASIYVDANNDVQETHVQRFVKAVEYLQLKPNQSILNVSSRDAEAEDFIRKACPETTVIHAGAFGQSGYRIVPRIHPDSSLPVRSGVKPLTDSNARRAFGHRGSLIRWQNKKPSHRKTSKISKPSDVLLFLICCLFF